MSQFKLFHGYKEKLIRWRSHNGDVDCIHDLTTEHINNILNCFMGNGNMRIPNPYEGRTSDEWQIIFNLELIRRRRNERI